MRLLQLSPQFPFPLSDGGKISIANMTKALVQLGCVIDMICLCKHMPSRELIDDFLQYTGAHCTCIQHDTSNSIKAIVQSLIDLNNPLYIRKHYSKEFESTVVEFLQENHYDGILCDHSAMAQYGVKASSVSGAPVIVRMHNIEHIIWERFADRFGSFDPRKFYVLSEARKLKRKEIEYLINVNYSAMITQRDVQALHDLEDNIRAIHVPVGIDTELFHPNESNVPRIPNRLIHATTYDWVHNVDAIDWFIREVMPTIQRKLGAELFLLGKHMPVRYQTMTDQGIHGLGFVEDINSMLNTASIYIAPLFVGAGIRIKILEAMSAGLPVIASKISAEGIKANREEGLIICNDANDFIAEISYLLMHPEEARVLGENARSFILKHHTWEHSAKLLKTLFLNR